MRQRRRERSRSDASRSEGLLYFEGSLLKPGLDVAGGASGDDGREAVVGEHFVGFSCVLGDAARACRRSDGAECDGVLARDDSDLRQPVAEGAVEEQLPPGAFGFGANGPECVVCAVDVEGEMVAADGDRTEEEAVAGELGVQSA